MPGIPLKVGARRRAKNPSAKPPVREEISRKLVANGIGLQPDVDTELLIRHHVGFQSLRSPGAVLPNLKPIRQFVPL